MDLLSAFDLYSFVRRCNKKPSTSCHILINGFQVASKFVRIYDFECCQKVLLLKTEKFN